MFLKKTAPSTKSEMQSRQRVYTSISIPNVSRNTIQSLLYWTIFHLMIKLSSRSGQNNRIMLNCPVALGISARRNIK